MKKLKAGVIGVGYLGRFHAQKYAALEQVDLVGVADTEADRAKLVADECGCRAFTDFRELLPLVDCVSVAVPTSQHFDVAQQALAGGVDVLLEKPMTVTLEEADELIALAEEHQAILQVGHLERFNPAVLALKPFLTTPVFIESSRISTFKRRGVDVDVVLDLMIHDIDIILTIIDSPLKTIHTVGAPVVTDTTDIANARLIFENGATANITVSRVSLSTVRKMRIFQPGSYLNVDFAKKTIMTIELKGELLESGMPRHETQVHSFAGEDALFNEIAQFTAHVRERTKPEVSGVEGRRALAVVMQVIDQIKAHQSLDLYRKIQAAAVK
ncbi:MAG: Gfo/Idh/MocA family oxidoreductase [Desulfofustis sp.]|jgi:predicted dehydrogenase|nr:Gfo/Idh/MocA family oxidoreductase [Desulfofustis sp.]